MMLDKTEELIENTGDITIQLASPDVIREWSFGEVTKPETINYRSFKPEKDGLFCEKIFGPVKNWECNCGKFKRIRYKGIICDRCGVEVTHSKVRRERMGHIELAVPVAHIWFFKNQPCIIGSLLDIDTKDLESVLYYERYIVFNPGDTDLKENELIDGRRYDDLWDEGRHFDAKSGAPAIRQLLARLDLDELSKDLRSTVMDTRSRTKREDALKRLKIVEAFRKSPNKPEWMILDVLPVIPPDLRPLVPLEGGRFATSDLNELYQRVINRNNRLKKLVELRAPEVILRNEKRLLQAAVDDLFDNGRRAVSRSESHRPLKSLSELLKGKQGRFRQNLLGKRVDYSGRSVIVVGPELRMHQCGLPKSMALELYKPFIIQRLQEEGAVHTLKSAKKFVEKERPEVWDILENIIEDHPVMLNRAPTLHRLGIQAFYPKLIEGKAIRLHPLVCAAFNADFDGDQMAVHLPLAFETQLECRVLMLSSNNILHPASGLPIAVPSQDMVLGLYYLSKPRPAQKGEGMRFYDESEVLRAYEAKAVDLNAWIYIRITAGHKMYRTTFEKDTRVTDEAGNEKVIKVGEKAEFVTLCDDIMLKTTPGRVFLNKIVPQQIGYANDTFSKKVISRSVDDLYRRTGNRLTVGYLDNLKDTGYFWATRAGSSVAIADMIIPPEKYQIVEKTSKEVEKILNLFNEGMITDGERYNQVIDAWSHATNQVANVMFDKLKTDRDGFNPVFMMADSGARGSREQIKQLSGMRGLMQKPVKKLGGQEVIENPIKSNFREGLNVLEYFTSTHGARKGLADTALKTADAGYLTRRLVDVAQDLVITEADCHTEQGIELYASKDGDDVVQGLDERILGRVAALDIKHPVTDEVLVAAGELMEEAEVRKIMDAGIEHVRVRSVLTCESLRGVCAKCYGRNLASGRQVDLGEAVGVIAAQSIGEPGTQLTLRTFHIGGASSRLTVESSKKAPIDGRVVYENMDTMDYKGQKVVFSRTAEAVVYDTNQILRARFQVPYGSTLSAQNGDSVKAGGVLFSWDPYNSVILANASGIVQYTDMVRDVTYREDYNESTGITTLIIIADKRGKRRPGVTIVDKEGHKIGFYSLPTGAIVSVKEGETVEAGHILSKIPRAVGKTRDITGGLPRVAELFEARTPKNPTVLAPMDGIVYYGDEERGNQKIIIKSESEKNERGDMVEQSVLVPRGKHLSVHEGDRVRAGQKVCDGSINPHDVLAVLGTEEVQRHLVDEIQAVYRLQGVAISDKHIECIVRQMMRKVRIKEPGDTELLPDEEISRVRLRLENERVVKEGKRPASYYPMLLGITKSSLAADSFISAASFQETTKILTRAAIEGRRDELVGLKENVCMGRLIPSGTGALHLRGMTVKDVDAEKDFERRESEQTEDQLFDSVIQLDGELEDQEEGGEDLE
ncbi:MAG TPA: DNA-directed RNA polymerase subunit beta' [Fibrobacteraceae bacterium]|nr:DNA-directed RNA polymerase subunit beta' [Fibrobacteraceae bacterium]